jgi:positive regulator of sigma E activity
MKYFVMLIFLSILFWLSYYFFGFEDTVIIGIVVLLLGQARIELKIDTKNKDGAQ